MDITIKKVGQQDGRERFILVNAESREVLTTATVSEAAVRRFFGRIGIHEATIDQCLERARARFAGGSQSGPEETEAIDNDLLFELGLGDDD